MATSVAVLTAVQGVVGALRCEAQNTRKQKRSVSVAALRNVGGAGCRSLRWDSSSIVGDGTKLLQFTSQRALRVAPTSLTVNAAAERSYIMIKPDGVQRGLVGEIISKFERKGFTLKGLKLFQTPKDLAETHYAELKERPFFPTLVEYIISGPVVCMVWEGPGVVASARKLIGATNPLNAEPGTIRGDFGLISGRNVIHGSDSPANGEREIGLWFNEGELVEWHPTITPWLLE